MRGEGAQASTYRCEAFYLWLSYLQARASIMAPVSSPVIQSDQQLSCWSCQLGKHPVLRSHLCIWRVRWGRSESL